MSVETVNVSISTATKVTNAALLKTGHSEKDAALITEMLMWAQMRKNNQSLVKVPPGSMNPIKGASDPKIEFESKLGIKIKGNLCPGIVGLTLTTDHVIRKVKEHGMAIGALYGTCTGTGPIGYYARKIAEEGFIGLVFCQSPELVAPHGGYKPLYGTNPIAYGIPRRPRRRSDVTDNSSAGDTANKNGKETTADDDHILPIVFDAAMSGITYFGLHELKASGQPVPAGLAYDADGNETTDPVAALSGAIRTFDKGPKGSNLAMMVELLGGALAGADMVDKEAKQNWGTTVLAIDPDILGGADGFFERVEDFVDNYRAQPTLQEKEKGSEEGKRTATRLSLPGERSEEIYKESLARGEVTVLKGVWDELLKMAE